jgi:hypothetical protein
MTANPPASSLQGMLSTKSADSRIFERVSGSVVAASNQEDVASLRAPGPSEKEKERHGPNSPLAVEEPAEARLDRLGRQRPEAFGSLWAEIGFVFSISMSQVLSVSHVVSPLEINISLTLERNTSCPDSLSFCPR